MEKIEIEKLGEFKEVRKPNIGLVKEWDAVEKLKVLAEKINELIDERNKTDEERNKKCVQCHDAEKMEGSIYCRRCY